MPPSYAVFHGTADPPRAQLASVEVPGGVREIVADGDGLIHVRRVSTPAGRHDAYLLPHVGLDAHLAALLRFLDSPARGRFAPRRHLTRPTPQRRDRLILMLRVARALRAGATRREIAARLLDRRARHMPSLEYSVSDIRQHLYRLETEGRAMIAGGYLDVLHHGMSERIAVPAA